MPPADATSSWVVTQPPPPPAAPPPPPRTGRSRSGAADHRGSAVRRRRKRRDAAVLGADPAQTGYRQVPPGQPRLRDRSPGVRRICLRDRTSSNRSIDPRARRSRGSSRSSAVVVLVGGIGAAVLWLPGSKPAEPVAPRPTGRYAATAGADRRRAANDRRDHHLDAAGRHPRAARRQARGRVADDTEGSAAGPTHRDAARRRGLDETNSPGRSRQDGCARRPDLLGLRRHLRADRASTSPRTASRSARARIRSCSSAGPSRAAADESGPALRRETGGGHRARARSSTSSSIRAER